MKIFPIFIPFAGCKNRCIYCQQQLITRTVNPDFIKIREQLSKFCVKYQEIAKEIAFYGGSFTLLSHKQQKELLNEIKPFIPFVEGIRVSTRPDGITKESLSFAANNRITTIELGIQSFDDHVLIETKRPYNSAEAIAASRAVKSAGIKLGIQLMPGLPGETAESIRNTIKQTISLQPNFVRIYPTLVLKDTEMAEMYQADIYAPLALEEAIRISAEMTIKFRKAAIKVIKIGLHSDLSADSVTQTTKYHTENNPISLKIPDLPDTIIAGPYHPAFGELVSQEILYKNIINSYQPNRSYLISTRAISLFKRDDEYLLKKIKKNLPINKLPVILDDKIEKEMAFLIESKPDFLW
ncbi:MAG: radical SAM protein [Candidatus Cloacimonetes bacterium]|nr:radical SAM protein [Candidatus Cloacimonadota bacterium]